MDKEKELQFPLYIATNDALFTVLGKIEEGQEYIEGKAYVADDGYAYIYKLSRPSKSMRIPVFWLNANGDPQLLRSGNFSDIGYRFKVENLSDYSIKKIIEITNPKEELFDADTISDMIDAVSIYKPITNDDDDALKKCVKATISAKEIDINRLKSKMDRKYMLSNLRQALTSKTKTSITNFNIWCEILGVEYKIVLYDNKTDPYNPLKNALVYSSKSDTVEEVVIRNEKRKDKC